MLMAIPDEFLELFKDDPFANLATVMPDGAPHVVPVWIGYDGEYLLTAGGQEHRRHANMRDDPRVALTVSTPADPYRALLVRGEVVAMDEEGGLDFLDAQARRRWGTDGYPYERDKPRYLVKIRPDTVVDTSSTVPEAARD